MPTIHALLLRPSVRRPRRATLAGVSVLVTLLLLPASTFISTPLRLCSRIRELAALIDGRKVFVYVPIQIMRISNGMAAASSRGLMSGK